MSLAAANRKFFDTIGDTYDSKPWWAKVNNAVTDHLRNHLDWVGVPFANTEGGSNNGKEVRLLDYACGPGLMSRIFRPYVTVTRGLDISPNMIATYNSRARDSNLTPSTIEGKVGDLFDKENPNPPEFNTPEWRDFDLATVGFGFHHFEDVVHAAKSLFFRLKPGGVLLISEFLEGADIKADENGNPIEGSEGDHAKHIHHHHGHDDHNLDRGGHVHEPPYGDHEHHGKEVDDNAKLREMINDSVVVPHFTVEGIKGFFAEAGFVEVEVLPLEEMLYMEFAGMKMWRKALFAKGKKPMGKSEL